MGDAHMKWQVGLSKCGVVRAWCLMTFDCVPTFVPMMAAGASRLAAIIGLRAHNRMSLSQNFIKNKHNWVWCGVVWCGGYEWSHIYIHMYICIHIYIYGNTYHMSHIHIPNHTFFFLQSWECVQSLYVCRTGWVVVSGTCRGSPIQMRF
jgi:hypothetical protein